MSQPPDTSTELNADGIYDLLSETTPETEIEKVPEKEPELDKEVEVEPEERSDIEIAEPDDKEIEIEDASTLVLPFKLRDLEKDFPELFTKNNKKYGYIKTALTRDQQFTEIFGTVGDAKEALEKGEALDLYEREIFNGDLGRILHTVKQHDAAAFDKIADSILSQLAKVDKEAYYNIVSNITKQTILGMVKEAKRTNNEQLQQAAVLLNQYMFGTSEFTPPQKLSSETPQSDTERKALHAERMTFVREQFETKRDELNGRIHNALKATVDNHIDPKGAMTDYVKRNAVRDALDTLDTLIHQDANLMRQIDKLWEKAFNAKFSPQTLDDIRKTYLSKAKVLLPAVIQRARNEAMKGSTGRKDDDEEREERRPVERNTRVPSDSNRERERPRGRLEMKQGESTKDFLLRD